MRLEYDRVLFVSKTLVELARQNTKRIVYALVRVNNPSTPY
jgi:hypothetical protein